jgi:hypothetical protein
LILPAYFVQSRLAPEFAWSHLSPAVAFWRARRAVAQPSLVTWWARATLSEPPGTSLVMQEPAPM